MPGDARHVVDAVWRMESARVISGLARMVRDVPLAEDLAQEALVAALETWPRSGVPDNPGAWLMATAKHRAIDLLRRSTTLERKQEELAREIELQLGSAQRDVDAELDDHVGDDLLRLIFMTCHPVLSTQARAALTLRLLGGLTTDEIARAFLVPEPTVAQRIVRAKRTLAEARIAFLAHHDMLTGLPNRVALSQHIEAAMAQAGLNIHNMVNKSRGEMAYTLVDVDSPVDATVLSTLRAIDGVLAVRSLPLRA